MSADYSIGLSEDYSKLEPVVLVKDVDGFAGLQSAHDINDKNSNNTSRKVKRSFAQSSSGGAGAVPEGGGRGAPPRPKRGQANKRERVRTENVNAGFEKLRELIPTDPIDRKLSKIEILRLATSYINHLYNLTKASSCLEAEEMECAGRVGGNGGARWAGELGCRDNRLNNDETNQRFKLQPMNKQTSPSNSTSSSSSSSSSSPPMGPASLISLDQSKAKPRVHVCTFCLMLTKAPNALATMASAQRKR